MSLYEQDEPFTVRELIERLLKMEMEQKVFFDFERNREGNVFRATKIWKNDTENVGIWITYDGEEAE